MDKKEELLNAILKFSENGRPSEDKKKLMCTEAFELAKKYNVEIIGVKADAIERGEDRIAFKKTMNKLGVPMPKSKPSHSVKEAEKIVEELGYPVVIKPNAAGSRVCV